MFLLAPLAGVAVAVACLGVCLDGVAILLVEGPGVEIGPSSTSMAVLGPAGVRLLGDGCEGVAAGERSLCGEAALGWMEMEGDREDEAARPACRSSPTCSGRKDNDEIWPAWPGYDLTT